MNQNIDKLNIILIIVAAILAYHFPLELFILAYAILGPLHYVTEIKWLNDKKFFFGEGSKVYLWITILAALLIFLPKLYYQYGNMDSTLGELILLINSWSNSAIFICLLIAIGKPFIRSNLAWIFLAFVGIIGSILLHDDRAYNDIIGLFVPTIIHVYLFTLLFMLFGARKSKSKFGYIAVVIAVIIPFIITSLNLEGHNYHFGQGFKDIYLENNFHRTPVIFAKYLGITEGKSFFFYETMELKLLMFMSFIYLYHYLNWFSKTTVIKWHKQLNYRNSVAILFIWFVCLTLYYVDFKLGILFSLFLSFIHVFLEFPLNILSIKGLLQKTIP